ncbi:hypothetical protein H5410_033840 [Solanum commersonii]|uniref:Uncharacterized protein n=1 Tax=Solanum commersonii TaxID=4109 RepID=A0A9J5YU96_SOLCO|nr:hypothetical protein H5410_033840 [Solanum commersonii]
MDFPGTPTHKSLSQRAWHGPSQTKERKEHVPKVCRNTAMKKQEPSLLLPPKLSSFPYGFFTTKHGEYIKPEVMGALNHFYQQCHLVRHVSFIALIPKKGPQAANRNLSGELVTNYQRAFIKHGQIIDETTATNEGEGFCLTKLRKVGFRDKLIRRIKFNISTVKYSSNTIEE